MSTSAPPKSRRRARTSAPQPKSAAAPSPFPPIAEYAFLSNCHTGALIAADGSIDWLCFPSFDSASVFGSLLDRQAGSFRLGPFGITHPVARAYVAGTNVMVTTWRTPTGWVEVLDALTMGPRNHEDEVTPHTRPPADDDADHMLVRTVRCVAGRVEVELVCEPCFDYGREPADLELVDGGRHAADASGAGQTVSPRHPISRWVSRRRASGRGTCWRRATARSARCLGRRGWLAGGRRGRRRPDRSNRAVSGATGWGRRGFPTIVFVSRCSAPP